MDNKYELFSFCIWCKVTLFLVISNIIITNACVSYSCPYRHYVALSTILPVFTLNHVVLHHMTVLLEYTSVWISCWCSQVTHISKNVVINWSRFLSDSHIQPFLTHTNTHTRVHSLWQWLVRAALHWIPTSRAWSWHDNSNQGNCGSNKQRFGLTGNVEIMHLVSEHKQEQMAAWFWLVCSERAILSGVSQM